MSLAYYLIASKLWRGLKREIRQSSVCLGKLREFPSRINRERSMDREHPTIIERTTMFNSRCDDLGGPSNSMSSSKRSRCSRINHRTMSAKVCTFKCILINNKNF